MFKCDFCYLEFNSKMESDVHMLNAHSHHMGVHKTPTPQWAKFPESPPKLRFAQIMDTPGSMFGLSTEGDVYELCYAIGEDYVLEAKKLTVKVKE